MDWTRRELLRIIPLGIGAGFAGCNVIDGDEEMQSTTGRRNNTAMQARPNGEETTVTTPTAGTHQPPTKDRESSLSTGTHPATSELNTVTTKANDRATHTVGMFTGLYFDPVGLYIEPGETISFKNISGTHSATAFHPDIETYSIDPKRRVPKDASPWNTGTISTVGKSKNITLETKGTYDYFCIPHVEVGMVGRIVVGEPGGPATGNANPYTSYYPLPESKRIVNEKEVSFDAVKPS